VSGEHRAHHPRGGEGQGQAQDADGRPLPHLRAGLAGIDAGEIECREGFSLVMKTSNGLPMCLKVDSAIRMIENGFAVPVN